MPATGLTLASDSALFAASVAESNGIRHSPLPFVPSEASMSPAKAEASRTLIGIALAVCGWAAFSVQDAIVKWLVVKLPVPEVLFARSVMIVLLASVVVRRRDLNALM